MLSVYDIYYYIHKFTSLLACAPPGSVRPIREVCTDCLWPVGGSGRRNPFHSPSTGLDWRARAPGAAGYWPVPRAKAPGGRSALGERIGLEDPLSQAPWTARSAKVGKAQLWIPVREGEREQNSVGGTWGTSDWERDHTVSLIRVEAGAGRTQQEVLVPTPFIKGHQGHTWWLGNDDHVAGQPDITGSPALPDG